VRWIASGISAICRTYESSPLALTFVASILVTLFPFTAPCVWTYDREEEARESTITVNVSELWWVRLAKAVLARTRSLVEKTVLTGFWGKHCGFFIHI
jgi:hypothetical protein